MKIKLACILIFSPLILFAQAPDLNHQYTVQELKEDFQFLRNKMERHNVNLYLYSPKKAVDSLFDAMYAGIEQPMTATEFYFYITAIQPYIKDGHNYLLPSRELQDYYASDALYFPLNFTEHEEKIYVTQNLSGDNSIKIGDEIKSVNGKKAIDLFHTLVSHQVRDGNNLLYAEYLSEAYFRSFYAFMFGFSPSYKVEIADAAGKIMNKTISGEKLAVIKERKNAVKNPRYDRTNFEKGIDWKIDTVKNYALLNIRTWSNSLLHSLYQQKFKKETDQFMEELRKSTPANLIIDLRGNQGGDGGNGIYLLRYLLDKPFIYFSSVKAYRNNMELKNAAPALTKINEPMSDVFKGNVYVLTDAGSFSNSAIFASLIQTTGRGKTAGGETGGNGIVLSGGEGYFIAPNTGINLLKITNQMIITDQFPNRGRGVQPDISIQPTLKEILDNNDVVMKRLLERIEE